MTTKETRNYNEVLQHIKELVHETTGCEFAPQSTHVDLEAAQVRAIRETLGSEIRICYFHILQCLRRKLCSLGFKKYVDQDPRGIEFWKWLCGMPNLDLSDAELREKLREDLEAQIRLLGLRSVIKRRNMKTFQDYLIKEFIGENPVHPTDQWALGLYIKDNPKFSRTNNSSESSNSRLNKNFKQPVKWNTVVERLRAFKIDTSRTYLYYTEDIHLLDYQHNAGQKPSVRSYDRERLEEVRRLVIEFSEMSAVDQQDNLTNHLLETGRLRRKFFNQLRQMPLQNIAEQSAEADLIQF